MPHFSLKTGGVRRVYDYQGFHATGVPHRIEPGDDSTPIMSDQNGMRNLSGIEESGDIVHQGFHSVGVNGWRACRAAISS